MDVFHWQNIILETTDENGMTYSPVYLKTIHNQLSALFNHAMRFYGLPENPAAKAGNMGKEKCGEVLVWTKDEYLQFNESDRLFPFANSYLHHEMRRGCATSGVKRIKSMESDMAASVC